MAAWPGESISGSYRLAGYIESMQNAGLPIHDVYILRGQNHEQAGRDALTQWFQIPNYLRPTACIAITDVVAIGMMNKAEAMGLTLPKELSIIGFDDSPMSAYLRPALSTLRQAIPQTSQTVMDILEALLNNSTPIERYVLIPPRLIVRESCTKPHYDTLGKSL